MSLLQWPFSRKQYPGIGNPRFVSDIVAANEAVLDAIKAVTGLGNPDFAILSGMDYTPGSPNGTYTAGVFYLDGTFYYMDTIFSEGLYLLPDITDTMPQPFDDGNSRLIYTLLGAVSTSNPTGATPIFSGNMNAYRIGLDNIKTQVLSIASTISNLGNAAFMNVGNVGGTVAAGDDPRFGYTKPEADNKFAQIVNVLLKTNTTAYTPSGDYNPSTKLYADQAAGFKLLWLGNISSNGGTITKLAGTIDITTVDKLATGGYRVTHNSGSNIFVNGMGRDPALKFVSPRSIINLDTFTFEVWLSDDNGGNDADFQIAIYRYY